MGIFTKRSPKPSKVTRERLERAEQEYQEQLVAHEEAKTTKAALQKALAENHIAQLMYEALSAKRGDNKE